MSGNVSSESDDDLARKVSSAQHPPSTTSSRENLQPVKTANSGFHRRSLPRAIIRRKSSQLESFAPYDPELADRSVHFSNLIFDARFWQMLKTAASYIFATILDKLSPPKGKEATEARRRERAMRLKATCIELGETFIKLAQFLSVRRDFLPTEIADELAQLQDQVPPFDFTVVAATIQKDLGAPPEEIFASFDPLPLASASVGQVHLARLKNGTEVVVKVQRPDLRQRFYQDLGYMRLVVNWGRTLLGKNFDWDGWIELSDEFGRNLFCEVNYIQEGRNADKLRRVLRDFEDVRIPRVFWKYTGRRVLTLEYAPGTKIDKLNELHARSINLPKLARLLVNCYLEQVLMHGFFHADPHAGNLSIDDEGRLVIYDFGMMGEITEEQRAAITGCISAVIRRSTAELVENLRQLGILKHSANAQPVERALQPFIDYYAGKEIRDLDFTDLEHDIDQIAFDRSLCLPPSLAYLLRAGTTIEGIARTLQPNFSFVEAAKPALKKWIMSRPQQAVPLLKLFYAGNVTLLEETVHKFNGSGETPNQSNGHKKNMRNSNGTSEKSADHLNYQLVSPATSDSQNLSQLKERANLLETRVRELARKRRTLVVMTSGLVLANVLYIGSTQISEIRPLLPYFLIGNGVMVAIIMWHLVIPVSLITRSGKPDTQGGNGD